LDDKDIMMAQGSVRGTIIRWGTVRSSYSKLRKRYGRTNGGSSFVKRRVVTTNTTRGCRRLYFVATTGRVGYTFISKGAEQLIHVSVID
jgi:hypothetical protein